jgi:2-phospho-L-lactate guanylyltransferase
MVICLEEAAVDFILPIRSFSKGFERLASVASSDERGDLAKKLAGTVASIAASHGSVTCVTADSAVVDWANSHGYGVIKDPGRGLNEACRLGIDAAESRWAVLHADLPYLSSADVEDVIRAGTGDVVVLCPTHDGGTSLISGTGPQFEFSYGVGSFHRHLAGASARARVVVLRGFALDLDTPYDLERWAERER